METEEFLSKLDHERIVKAIRSAEAGTSSEIRIYVDRRDLRDDPVSAGQREFIRLGMDKTRQRNAVLIYVAPRAQEFAVIGDEEVHRRCGAELWQQVADKMSEHFGRAGSQMQLSKRIGYLADVLAQHFPRRWREIQNELPDDVIET